MEIRGVFWMNGTYFIYIQTEVRKRLNNYSQYVKNELNPHK
ncbi:hypothetical protein bcere0024_0470 [Bacillus cereus Rock4-18]|nr:hypothetical protein bcere0024_0470 [Bacillus cereus Rock4-18]